MNLGLGNNIASRKFLAFLAPYMSYVAQTQDDGADLPPLKAIEHGTQVEVDFSSIRSVPSLLCTCDTYYTSGLASFGALYTIIPE